MKLFNNHKHLLFFIVGSLLLLAILEGFWLKNLYAEQREQLRENIDQFVFSNMSAMQITLMAKNNVRLIDSFLSEKEGTDQRLKTMFVGAYDKNGKMLDTYDFIDKPHFSIKNGKKNVALSTVKTMNIVINDSSRRKKGGRDSFLNRNAYQFQRFVSGLIKPEELKEKLESKFPQLSFNISRMDADSMIEWNRNKGIVTTYPAGSRTKVDEYGVSYKDQKMAVVAHDFQYTIFKAIYPETLFALFVLCMIGVSFWLIYRSFLQQKYLIALKNDFISNVTHELKTPIATVGVAIEALNSFNALDNPSRTKEYLDISKSELNRLTLLVDKVLKMAVFEQGNPQLNIETFDLFDLTQGILSTLKLQFEKYDATVSLEKKGEDFSINADKTHITSVIYNLLDNALKYGGEKPVIHITLQSLIHQFFSFSVRDKGAGIPPQYQDKIFEKFFRIPTGDVHTTKGHGLGLSYIKSVIEQHKGKINVDSEEGKGCIFTFFLPLSEAV
jgi:two-component system, OmpR family, phosphate regulon sensor histidine kinase PhoR